MRPLARPAATVAGCVTALLLAACGSSLSSDTAATGSSPGGSAKVALLVPKSGVYAPLGEDMEQGFRSYLQEKGGKLGGKTVDVSVVDEGAGPETGVPAGQKLAAQADLSAVVGIVNSAVALGLRETFQEARKPLIVANAGADAITGASRSDYVWRTSFANSEPAAALGKHVADQVKGGSVYLVAPDYAAGKEFLDGFEKAFTAAGGKVAGRALPPFGKTSNYQPFLAGIQSSGAAAVFAFFAGSEAVGFVKQYRELGVGLPLYAPGFLTEGGVLQAQGEAAAGIQTSLHYSDQLDNPRNKAFTAAYRTAYDEAPTTYAVQAYDAAQALDMALSRGTSGEQVIAGLKAITSIDSPRGPFSFTAGQGPKQTYYLRVTEPGTAGLVNRVVSTLAAP